MYQRILVPIDGSVTSTRGLDEAIRLARSSGGKLRLIHIVDPLTFATGFEVYSAYAGDVATLIREAGVKIVEQGVAHVKVAGLTAEGESIEAIGKRVADVVAEQAQAWKADLIVIGTHGRRGVRRMLLGSDAEQIARTVPTAVLLVRLTDEEEAAAVAATAPATAV